MKANKKNYAKLTSL